MSLFTDGTLSEAKDLRRYETSILDVASVEGIELADKLELAQREISVEITAFLLQRGVELGLGRELGRVFVTEPMRQWHSLQTLALIYRDAYNSQLNDRYLGKWKEYERLAKWAHSLLLDTGVGLVHEAVRAADPPECGVIPGFTPTSAADFIAVAWQSATGRIGAHSPATVQVRNAGQLLTVQVVNPPIDVSFWHVYAGATEATVFRQNGQPLALDAIWIESVMGLSTQPTDLDVTGPDLFVSRRRQFQRG